MLGAASRCLVSSPTPLNRILVYSALFPGEALAA
jgi:hypothetical protein